MFDRRRPKGRLFSLMVAVVTAIGLRGLSFGLRASGFVSSLGQHGRDGCDLRSAGCRWLTQHLATTIRLLHSNSPTSF
jgi:hypothetical protein